MTTTLRQLLKETTRRDPARPALHTEHGSVSYAELDAGVERLAAILLELGRGGRRTGLLLPNLPAFPVALHAIFEVGGSALLLSPANSRRELAEQLADAQVETVLTTDRLAPRLPPEAMPLLIDDAGVPAAQAEPEVAASEPPAPRAPEPDDEAVVIFTAAVDGRARGAVLTHRNLVANLRSTIEAMQMTGDDIVYGALPFTHAFGLTVCLNAPLALGASVAPAPRFSATAALDAFEELGVTVLAGVPAMFIGLLGGAEKRGTPEHRLRVTLCGGAPLPLQIARDWEGAFELPLRQGYGLTEASPVCLFNRVGAANRIGTMGEPLAGVEISIRGPAGEELEEGEVGELHVRGENVFGGYLEVGEDADAAARAVGAAEPLVDGWLRTGDLASRHDGAVRFRGTLKPMFTRNGFNIYPAEIRRTLLADPRIAEVRVLARADPVREYEIVLEVQAAPDADLDEESVREVCSDRLALYKQPSHIRILN